MTLIASNARRPTVAPPALRPLWGWALAGLAVGLLLSISLGLRASMLRDRLPVEGQYAVNVQYGPWFIANRGTLYDVEGQIPTISNFTSGMAYGAVDFTATTIHGDALILSGLRDPVEIGSAYMSVPWQPLLLLPIAVVAIYYRLCVISRARPRPVSVAVLFALAVFGHYSMVVWGLSGGLGVAYGWIVFLAIYLVILARAEAGRQQTSWALVLVLLLCLLQPTYHTIAVAIFILTTTVAIAQRWVGETFVPVRTAVLVAVLFVGFLAYHATPFLDSYAHFGLTFLNDLLKSRDMATSPYLFRLDGPLQALQIVNYVAIGLVTLALLGVWYRTRRHRDRILNYHLLWILGLIPLGFGFFVWDGLVSMVIRLLQAGILLTCAGAAILLARPGRWSHALVAASVIVATTVSALTVHAASIGNAALITDSEWRAIQWYGATGCERILLTDFRVGAAMPYAGCFGVIGPSTRELARQGQPGLLTDLFYSDNPTAIANAAARLKTTDGRTADLIMISREMTKHGTGPVLADGRLVPMSEQTWAAYSRLPGWSVVYTNGEVVILGKVSVARQIRWP